jgi:hypothetical protein
LLKALDPTAEQLTAMFEIPISGANTQRAAIRARRRARLIREAELFSEHPRRKTGF